MEDKGESKFRNVMERYWYALFIIAVALAAAVIGFICEAWKMQEGFLYDLLTSIISTTIAFFLFTLTYQLLTKIPPAYSSLKDYLAIARYNYSRHQSLLWNHTSE